MAKGKLFLVPTTLGSEDWRHVIPAEVAEQTIRLRHFAVEDIKSARRYLRKLDREFPIDDSTFFTLNKKTPPEELLAMVKVMADGHDLGILSEAGCPGIADPGADLVALAHRKGYFVSPLTGPSSILLGLIGSGFNGQQFSFHGYLPKERKDRIRSLKEYEREARISSATQIFMDTPFRNMNVLDDLLNELQDDSLLCIACDLTLPTERIQTMRVADWRENAYDLSKRPTMFLLGKFV
jgi:16S rRNA (cytidine1402-2'-O)-methyltransferase